MDPDFEECHSPYESVYSGATGDIRGNHCYDSYYAVYSENDQEYFADDNPLSALNIEESRRLDFSGDLGNKIKQSADDAEGGMFDSKISTG